MREYSACCKIAAHISACMILLACACVRACVRAWVHASPHSTRPALAHGFGSRCCARRTRCLQPVAHRPASRRARVASGRRCTGHFNLHLSELGVSRSACDSGLRASRRGSRGDPSAHRAARRSALRLRLTPALHRASSSCACESSACAASAASLRALRSRRGSRRDPSAHRASRCPALRNACSLAPCYHACSPLTLQRFNA